MIVLLASTISEQAPQNQTAFFFFLQCRYTQSLLFKGIFQQHNHLLSCRELDRKEICLYDKYETTGS